MGTRSPFAEVLCTTEPPRATAPRAEWVPISSGPTCSKKADRRFQKSRSRRSGPEMRCLNSGTCRWYHDVRRERKFLSKYRVFFGSAAIGAERGAAPGTSSREQSRLPGDRGLGRET